MVLRLGSSAGAEKLLRLTAAGDEYPRTPKHTYTHAHTQTYICARTRISAGQGGYTPCHMPVQTHTRTRTRTHAHVHTRARTHACGPQAKEATPLATWPFDHTCIHTHVHTRVRPHMHTHTCARTHACLWPTGQGGHAPRHVAVRPGGGQRGRRAQRCSRGGGGPQPYDGHGAPV